MAAERINRAQLPDKILDLHEPVLSSGGGSRNKQDLRTQGRKAGRLGDAQNQRRLGAKLAGDISQARSVHKIQCEGIFVNERDTTLRRIQIGECVSRERGNIIGRNPVSCSWAGKSENTSRGGTVPLSTLPNWLRFMPMPS